MNKILLSTLGAAAVAAFTTTANAYDGCHGSRYYEGRIHVYRPSYTRVYYAPVRPTYYRSYYYDRDDRRCEYRSHYRHHGVRGFFERLCR